jgi:hypothetical protein
MLSGANAFEISDIERMDIGEHQPAAQDVTMLHALWLPEITIRQPQDYFLFAGLGWAASADGFLQPRLHFASDTRSQTTAARRTGRTAAYRGECESVNGKS